MFRRQKTGSVVCTSCGRLVGVTDDRCLFCGRRNPSLWGFAPAIRTLGEDLGFGKIVIGACVILYVIALGIDPSAIGQGGLMSMLAPSNLASFRLGAAGAIPVFALDRWWTLLSAGFLHGNLLHIGFNLYWLTQLSPVVSQLYGPGRSILLFQASSVFGFLATSFVGYYMGFLPSFLHGATSLTLGASAAIFGWLGALVYYGKRTGSSRLRQQMMGFVLPLFLFGFLFPGIDNWAHAGGFLSGYALAVIFDPLKPERIDHVVLALVSLLASAAAVLVSLVLGLPSG